MACARKQPHGTMPSDTCDYAERSYKCVQRRRSWTIACFIAVSLSMAPTVAQPLEPPAQAQVQPPQGFPFAALLPTPRLQPIPCPPMSLPTVSTTLSSPPGIDANDASISTSSSFPPGIYGDTFSPAPPLPRPPLAPPRIPPSPLSPGACPATMIRSGSSSECTCAKGTEMIATNELAAPQTLHAGEPARNEQSSQPSFLLDSHIGGVYRRTCTAPLIFHATSTIISSLKGSFTGVHQNLQPAALIRCIGRPVDEFVHALVVWALVSLHEQVLQLVRRHTRRNMHFRRQTADESHHILNAWSDLPHHYPILPATPTSRSSSDEDHART
eukprot:6206211-Pleurochrysis_carterae.AAC.4